MPRNLGLGRLRGLGGLMRGDGGAKPPLIYDTFAAANGTLLTAHTPDITTGGAGWEATFANYGLPEALNIQSNKAANNTNAVTVGGSVIETGKADVTITATITTVASAESGGNGIVFRYQDTQNYWTAELLTGAGGGNKLRIGKVESNEFAAVTTVAATVAQNTDYEMTITLSGNNITVAAAGTTATATSSKFATATKHGILSVSANSSTYSKVDNFRVSSNPNSPPGEGGPTALQAAYLAQQFGMFLHYNMSTFVDVEWADPNIDVDTFAPTGLDINNWMDAAVSAGMKYAVLTAKHHDGFALWPTAYAVGGYDPYGIGSTAWYASSAIDIVDEFATQCAAHSINPCLYFSIWDRTYEARSDKTAAGDPAAYIAMIEAQLSELLTNYGNITAIWTDGWGWQADTGYTNIPYATISNYIKSIQPNCMLVENAHTHPSVTSEIETYEQNETFDLNGNTRPSEVCSSIRVNERWFYRSTDGQADADIKTAVSLNALIQTYNGNNANYLLNVTPTTAGVLPEAQVTRLAQLHT